MGVSLAKGGNVSLTEESPGLESVVVGLGWDARTTTGRDFDLDASALLLDAQGRVLGDAYFVFFNNLRTPDGSVVHTGDNRTGAGEGDDEQLTVRLREVPPEVARVALVVSIHDADARGQCFGQVRNAFVRVVDRAGGREIARYDLSEDAAGDAAVILGELYRRGEEWRFRALGQGYASGLGGIAVDLGVDVV